MPRPSRTELGSRPHLISGCYLARGETSVCIDVPESSLWPEAACDLMTVFYDSCPTKHHDNIKRPFAPVRHFSASNYPRSERERHKDGEPRQDEGNLWL